MLWKQILAAVKKERQTIDKKRGKAPASMRAAERDRLGALLVQYLATVGVEEDDGTSHLTFRLETSVGPLTVSYDLQFGNIFTHFEDPKRASKIVDCNPFSGKWNFHFDRETTADQAYEHFRSLLERLVLDPLV